MSFRKRSDLRKGHEHKRKGQTGNNINIFIRF